MKHIIFNKLLAQAQEAERQGLTKLAQNITLAVGESPNDVQEYSYTQFQDEVESDLWKAASRLITYYDLNSVDAMRIQEVIKYASEQLIDELETTLGVDGKVGPFEPKIPGEV